MSLKENHSEETKGLAVLTIVFCEKLSPKRHTNPPTRSSTGIGGKQLGGSTAVPSEEHAWGKPGLGRGGVPGAVTYSIPFA